MADLPRADCTVKCRSSQHAGDLVTAMSQPVPEAPLLAWLYRHCHAPSRARDKTGRSAVHAAASTGRLKVLKWLISYKEGSLNGKDGESGYSPLHRAVFSGQLPSVVFLIRQGANLSLCDKDGFTALDHAIADRPMHVSYEKHAPLEAYVWGTNANYNLGLGTHATRNNPDIGHPELRKDGTSISKVAMQKFHSAFVAKTGSVMTCGHGRGGRLGHGSETMQLIPKPVQLSAACVDVSLGVDHSMFLNEHGVVYTCGMNTYHQLGHHPPPPRLLAPAPIFPRGTNKQPPAKGVAAARFHSVFWTETAVFTWGLNAGQLGHMKGEKTIVVPKLVAALAGKDNIDTVVVSDGASVVLTAKGDVVALYEYGSKKLGSRQHGVTKMLVTGGHLDPAVDPGGHDDIEFKLVAGGGTNLKVFVLTRIGKISVWEENRVNSFIPCLFSLSRQVLVSDVALYRTGLLLVTSDGLAWQGTHQPSARRPTSPVTPHQASLGREAATDLIKLKRLQHVHRGVAAACDSKGRNFCVLQVCPNEALTEIPEISPSEMSANMRKLLEENSEMDPVCDVICVVGQKRFPAHRFVLASGSENLSKQLRFSEDEESLNSTMVIEVDDIEPEIFAQALKYLYYKSCDLFVEGPCAVNVKAKTAKDDCNDNTLDITGDPRNTSAFAVYSENKGRKKKSSKSKQECELTSQRQKSTNPISLLQEAAKNLGIYGLSKMLDCFRYTTDGKIVRKTTPPRPRLDFSNKNLSELHDVTIECEDGKCLFAHKCILATRSEYFGSMFSSSWVESSEGGGLSLPLPSSLVQPLLDYLYKDEVVKLNKSDDPEFCSNLLVLADQFLMKRLVEMCENQLTKLLTLKNVAEILQFSFSYSAEQLRRSAMQFICLNLPAVLENRSLEFLEESVLDSLGEFYRGTNPVFHHRRVTPYSGHPPAHLIEEEFAKDPVTWEQIEAAEEEAVKKVARKSKSRRHSSGDKRSSPRMRRISSDSLSSGSGSDSEDSVGGLDTFDRLSLVDFDIEEKDEVASPEPLSPAGVSTSQDKTYFSSLLSSVPVDDHQDLVQGVSALTSDTKLPAGKGGSAKKMAKMSQKERKRLSQEAAEVSKPEPAAAEKSGWVGWGSGQVSVVDDAPSLAEIMQMERSTTPTQAAVSVRPESGSAGRKMSESVRRLSDEAGKRRCWKQLDLNAVDDKHDSAAVTPVKSNPWNVPVAPASTVPKSLGLGSPHDDQSFQQILQEEVKHTDNLHRAKSKPLSLTQIEEKAIEELKVFYNADNATDEIITVSRVQTGPLATPVWYRHNKN